MRLHLCLIDARIFAISSAHEFDITVHCSSASLLAAQNYIFSTSALNIPQDLNPDMEIITLTAHTRGVWPTRPTDQNSYDVRGHAIQVGNFPILLADIIINDLDGNGNADV